MTQPDRRRNGLFLIAIAISLLFCLRLSPPPLLATNLFLSPESPLGSSTLTIPIKVFLRGPYNSTNSLMNDTLRAQNLLPTTEPYSALLRFAHVGGERVNPGVFAMTGRNAIVDWVLIELRNASDATRIVATRAALLQRDGDVVDMDGVSPVAFPFRNPGTYYVTVGHRNHLRVMTANPVSLNTTSALINFSNPATATSGANAQVTVGTLRLLWSGDANTNNRVVANGPGNDQNAVLTRVLTDPGNPQGNANYIVTGYGITDLNLDGKTIAAGANNDLNVILTTVLTHPGNSNQSGNYIVPEQIAGSSLVIPAAVPPVSLAAYIPTSVPYVLQNSDFVNPVSVAAGLVMQSQGLPVPATVPVPTDNAGSVGTPIASINTGWVSMFNVDFSTGVFPAEGQNGDCKLTLSAQDTNSSDGTQDYDWGLNNTRFHETPGAAWPFAAGNNSGGLSPGTQTYPANQTTSIICTFSGLNNISLKNIMVEFSLWLDEGDPFVSEADKGDFFFVGFNTGEANYYGHRWYKTPVDGNGVIQWSKYRFFYPEVAEKVRNNNGVLKIMWQFNSDEEIRPNTRGPWLDNLKVERYAQPEASASCENLDPKTSVPGVGGDGKVSKGLNLPPYAVDNGDRAGQTGRLREADTDWVRLEFKTNPTLLYLLNAQVPLTLPAIDLKHYDVMIDDLCANGIAVLGLLSYEMLLDRSWEGTGDISASYLEKYKRQTNLLTDYFSNRIKYWEVWNEPDFADSRLNADDYVTLLKEVRPIIKEHPNDQVVFGGLGGTDNTANNFFAGVQKALIDATIYPAPYDVFAIHPYPSGQWPDPNRNNLPKIDPYDYLDEEYPNVLNKFLTRMSDMGNRESQVWVTEIGWNRADESKRQSTKDCARVNQTMVDRFKQAKYLAGAFDVLFTSVKWDATKHAVPKVFWYQYGDTGIDLKKSDCGSIVAAARISPSWDASYWAQMTLNEETVNVDWWFGLYSGTDTTTPVPVPNLSRCTFAKYPNFTTVTSNNIRNLNVVEECLPVEVYLPTIRRDIVTQVARSMDEPTAEPVACDTSDCSTNETTTTLKLENLDNQPMDLPVRLYLPVIQNNFATE